MKANNAFIVSALTYGIQAPLLVSQHLQLLGIIVDCFNSPYAAYMKLSLLGCMVEKLWLHVVPSRFLKIHIGCDIITSIFRYSSSSQANNAFFKISFSLTGNTPHYIVFRSPTSGTKFGSINFTCLNRYCTCYMALYLRPILTTLTFSNPHFRLLLNATGCHQ